MKEDQDDGDADQFYKNERKELTKEWRKDIYGSWRMSNFMDLKNKNDFKVYDRTCL